MSDFREEEALGKAYDSHLLRRLMTYLRPYKWRVVFAVFLTLLVGPLEVLGPKLFGYTIDKYVVPGVTRSIPWEVALRGVTLISLISLAALLLSFAVQYLQVRIMQNVGQQTLYDLRKEIFERMQRLPMSFFDRSPVGRLVTRVTTDVDALNDL
ncbi:MAG TPA: ABC transporter transmembrane domain-containing protein, partial [Candidatus Methylomirabilis sp.]|nr:ABC transporter transmembrane domain-containing protein [Candidatus Methylomirabilis sp.]